MQNVAIGIVVVAFVLGALLLFRLATRPAKSRTEAVPAALRPGDTDDVLESDRLGKIQRWGAIASVAFAVFITIYWVAEPGRMRSKELEFAKLSVERGHNYFHDEEVVIHGQLIIPMHCSDCHGIDAAGGTNDYLDPNIGEVRTVQVPELRTIFARYPEPPSLTTRGFIFETIQRGRPGTDMPTWGNQFGGPLTDQQIDDIVNYLESIQETPTIEPGADGASLFAQFCAACHGQSGSGGSGPAMQGGSEVAQFPELADHIAFVIEGSRPGAAYGTSGQGTGGMPGWGSVLTEEQIAAVVEYERSL